MKKRREFFIKEVETEIQLENLFERSLITLYQEVFADPPYEETFTQAEVRSYFELYFLSGILLFCEDKESQRVIGFAAAVPLILEEAIAKIVGNFDINLEKTWYFAELGVDKSFRRKGIASALVKELIRKNPVEKLVMRTAENNVASIKVNEGMGFQVIPNMYQDVQKQRQNGTTQVDKRIFLIRKT